MKFYKFIGIFSFIFLFSGVGYLLIKKDIEFWPWILVVFSISISLNLFSKKKFLNGLNILIWFTGIAILIYLGNFWPAILYIIGISIIITALFKSV